MTAARACVHDAARASSAYLSAGVLRWTSADAPEMRDRKSTVTCARPAQVRCTVNGRRSLAASLILGHVPNNL